MTSSVNKVILIGNLGKAPEVKFNPQDNNKIVTLSIATSESWKDKATSERRYKTEWHRVVVFNEKLGEIAEKYIKKGSKVYLEGQLQTRKWTDKKGQENYTTEVVLGKFKGELTILESRSEAKSDFNDAQYPAMPSNRLGQALTTTQPPFLNDDVPF